MIVRGTSGFEGSASMTRRIFTYPGVFWGHTVEDVDALLTAALGEPQKRRDGQPGLEPIRIYNKRRVGVSLLIVGKDKGRVDRLSRLAFAMKGHLGKR